MPRRSWDGVLRVPRLGRPQVLVVFWGHEKNTGKGKRDLHFYLLYCFCAVAASLLPGRPGAAAVGERMHIGFRWSSSSHPRERERERGMGAGEGKAKKGELTVWDQGQGGQEEDDTPVRRFETSREDYMTRQASNA